MTVTLYRPVGLNELKLIAAADYTAFPARLPEQPIFYPVLNLAYAEQIAQDWNTASPPYAGFVTRFEISQPYADQFEVHGAGGKIHHELWVPSGELENFNRHMVGKIEIVAAFYGEHFNQHIDPETHLPQEFTGK